MVFCCRLLPVRLGKVSDVRCNRFTRTWVVWFGKSEAQSLTVDPSRDERITSETLYAHHEWSVGLHLLT